MYERIKHIARSVLPSSFIKNQKRKLRYVYGLLFRGSNFQCNLCEIKLRKFISLSSGDLICPNCGSLPRSRGLWNILKDTITNQTVLHFSPPESLKAVIAQKGNTKEYITTDFEGEFESEYNFDIENINIANESVDVIICYHILEHIENDLNAITELYRILNKNGRCYIQTPFKEGSIYEDQTITEPTERLKHFGQKDHLRIYSSEGLSDRLRQSGFLPELIELSNGSSNYYGLKTKDSILICRKHKTLKEK